MKPQSLFTLRLLTIWIAAAVATFALSLLLMGRSGEPGRGTDVGPNVYSHSAIGYAGLADMLRQLGTPIARSQAKSEGKLGKDGVLVIAEPSLEVALGSLTSLLTARRILLILPKWTGKPSRTHDGWLGNADLLPTAMAQAVLTIAGVKAEVVRHPNAEEFDTNDVGVMPSLDGPVQLLKSAMLDPVVAVGDAMLVGELKDKKHRIWVLSDPDLLENHGIGRGDNAAFAVGLIDLIRGPHGKVVFDETVHGFVAGHANPFRLLFQYPFVFATAQAAGAVLLLLWATLGRFGAPQAAPAPLAAGKYGLIENAANLLDYAGHHRTVVRRYVDETIRDVARRLRAPRDLSAAMTLAWLDRAGATRAVGVDVAALSRRAEEIAAVGSDPAALEPLARDIYLWKQELIDGTARHPRPHRRGAGGSAQGGGGAG